MIIRGMLYECEPNCTYCAVFNAPAIKRFWSYVNRSSVCWEYSGYLDPNGYGKFSYLGESVYAHVFSKSLTEKIDCRKECDHLCRNPSCVRPDHLEQVTHHTNVMRSHIAVATINNKKAKCVNGHKLLRAARGRKRDCALCNTIRMRSDPRKEYMRKYMRTYNKSRLVY